MLRISRFIAVTSALLLTVALILVGWFYYRSAVHDLVDMTARHNVAIDRILTNAILSRYEDFISASTRVDPDELRARDETAELTELVGRITAGTGVLRFKIYGPEGMTLFSTDHAQIGEDYSASHAFQRAMQEGETSSELSFEDSVSAFSGEVFDRDVVETYIPHRDENGQVEGVFEIYTDVTEVMAHIRSTTFRLLFGLVAIFAAVYAILTIGIARHAISPVNRASELARQIGPGSSGVRLPADEMPRELRPLVEAMNGALARLDNALEVRSRFAADAAHELLTPLTLLRSGIEELPPSEARDALISDADSMTGLVRQLLHLAELEATGTVAGDNETADLHAVAVRVVTMLAPAAVADGKAIALTGADAPVMVRGGEVSLSQVLRNLIENAVRHTPRGTTAEVELSPDGTVKVVDQGPGIPEAERETVFLRFWRGDARAGSGKGLGLSIVARIVAIVGGEIRADTSPDGGACFVVRLPLVDGKAASAVSEADG